MARDYSQPVQFTITAPDGAKVVYTVTVKAAECLTPAAPPVTPPVVPPVIPPVVPPVVPTACTADAIGSTGYSLVFKGCSAANVAEYYDKTECVRDNATGLIWQGQTPAGTGLRANDRQFTNYYSVAQLQKSIYSDYRFPIYTLPTQSEIDDPSNSVGFKKAVDATNLCGSNQWRIPSKDELFSIVVNDGRFPLINQDWFVNLGNVLCWTSTQVNDTASTYHVWFDGDGIGYDVSNLGLDGIYREKSSVQMCVRLVR